MQYIVVAALLLILSVASFCQTPQPLREVKGRVLKSTDMPAVDVEFGKPFKYVGGQRFVLYNVANAEQHFIVDADKNGRIKRLYWLQFEGYLPGLPHSYDYKGARSVSIGGLDFFADTYARNIKLNPGRPDGDAAHGRAFLESKGYKLGSDETITARFLHYIGEKKRDELMIIYLEDLADLGVTAADVAKGGKDEAKFSEIAEAFLARAQKDIKIRQRK